jgi:putative Mn2+ efflux pump MntP
MDDSFKRLLKRKSNDSSVNTLLICFLFTLAGLICGTVIGGLLQDYIHAASEIPGPVLAIGGFAWGLSFSRRKYAEK